MAHQSLARSTHRCTPLSPTQRATTHPFAIARGTKCEPAYGRKVEWGVHRQLTDSHVHASNKSVSPTKQTTQTPLAEFATLCQTPNKHTGSNHPKAVSVVKTSCTIQRHPTEANSSVACTRHRMVHIGRRRPRMVLIGPVAGCQTVRYNGTQLSPLLP